MPVCITLVAVSDCGYETIREKTIKAANDYVCCECGIKINRGEMYVHEIAVTDGQTDIYTICLDCHNFRSKIICDFHYGRVWEDFKEWLEYEDHNELPWDEIAELRPRAKDKVLGIIQDDFNMVR
jgi:hypothetical protein